MILRGAGLKAHKELKGQMITEQAKVKWFERCKRLRKHFAVERHRAILFSDDDREILENKVTMMKWTFLSVLVLACILNAFAWADAGEDANIDQLMARVYRTVLLKSKRSPSMGLSLAEYMANPQGGDNFHFIPSGRK
ncbi:hypothetical protein Y032_0001g482 [Ancylostoma ceylanicum]|nr:hypothetical protein Y032_0001g482 [Ancylostoma ceylanicum]